MGSATLFPEIMTQLHKGFRKVASLMQNQFLSNEQVIICFWQWPFLSLIKYSEPDAKAWALLCGSVIFKLRHKNYNAYWGRGRWVSKPMHIPTWQTRAKGEGKTPSKQTKFKNLQNLQGERIEIRLEWRWNDTLANSVGKNRLIYTREGRPRGHMWNNSW